MSALLHILVGRIIHRNLGRRLTEIDAEAYDKAFYDQLLADIEKARANDGGSDE